ncbi:C-type lectin domain family 4 member E-like [Mobula birostris]|uniref:C-type lectin domain family 4 member E-like n=1 Tax=Mobula birostris TaxID=1983395 RepID=UPI003B288300
MDVKGSYEVSGGATGRKLSPRIIYFLLGFSVLMSFVILGTVIHLNLGSRGDIKVARTFLMLLETPRPPGLNMAAAVNHDAQAHTRDGLRGYDAAPLVPTHSSATPNIPSVTENSMKARASLDNFQVELAELAKNLSHGQPFNQWRRFNNKLYYFSSNRHNWNESLKFCDSMKSLLVVINNKAEQEFLQRNIKCGHWIGLHDTQAEGVWHWVDDTDYATNFKNWAPGQPNNMGMRGQDCALIVGTGGWYEWHCNYWHYPICEKPED